MLRRTLVPTWAAAGWPVSVGLGKCATEKGNVNPVFLHTHPSPPEAPLSGLGGCTPRMGGNPLSLESSSGLPILGSLWPSAP